MLKLLACLATFLLASSILARLAVDEEGGLLTIVGNGANCGKEARAPILDKAAVMVAAVMLAIAAFIVMFDIPATPKGREPDKGKAEFGFGKGSWRTVLGLRLSGMGTPALAHIAAALALAISSSCSLSVDEKQN